MELREVVTFRSWYNAGVTNLDYEMVKSIARDVFREEMRKLLQEHQERSLDPFIRAEQRDAEAEDEKEKS